eukprot:Platyproteum_vivax@DN2618_c0_g1_i1.p1
MTLDAHQLEFICLEDESYYAEREDDMQPPTPTGRVVAKILNFFNRDGGVFRVYQLTVNKICFGPPGLSDLWEDLQHPEYITHLQSIDSLGRRCPVTFDLLTKLPNLVHLDFYETSWGINKLRAFQESISESEHYALRHLYLGYFSEIGPNDFAEQLRKIVDKLDLEGLHLNGCNIKYSGLKKIFQSPKAPLIRHVSCSLINGNDYYIGKLVLKYLPNVATVADDSIKTSDSRALFKRLVEKSNRKVILVREQWA